MKTDTRFILEIFILIAFASAITFGMGYDMAKSDSNNITIDVPAEVEAKCPVPSVQLVNDTRYITKEIEVQVPKRTSMSDYKKIVENYEYYTSDSLKGYLYLGGYPQTLNKAKEFNSSSMEEIVDNTITFLKKITYKYSYYPNPIYETIDTMVGDCTDIANLGVELLRENGVYARVVHGWIINEDGVYIKHDWIEVLYPIQSSVGWVVRDDYFGYNKIEKKGEGVW